MLSDDEHTHAQEHHVKRRRLHGACDICRKKKIKCNSAEMPDKICSNCIAYNLECTHNIPRQANKKDTEKGYVRALEERLDKMEQLLRNVRPELDLDQSTTAANSPESAPSAPSPPSITYSRNTPVTDLPYPTPQTLPDNATFQALPPGASNESSEEDDLSHISLSEHLNRLAVDTVEDRFFGKSSAFMLVKHATNVKQEMTGIEFQPGRNLRRPLYWDLRSWERDFVNSDLPQFVFPDKDLLDDLVNLYFERSNIYIPVLHRPTFERDLANDLHLHDVGFAQLVLIVCALASRSTGDPRVILQGDKTRLSSGFKYFCQTRLLRNKLLDKASLYDLQYYCLVVPYLLASSLPQAAWNVLGLALRFIQERGVHRRHGEGYKPTAADELWKRCFWCLVTFDRLCSSFVGRTCGIQDEDFDADPPIECDDEYWECDDPEQNWKQPPGKPSKITAFNAQLRLCEILAFTLRTLYSTKKSKLLTGLIGNEWEERVVAELDSSMNSWKDSLPDHLRWDPNQGNITFLQQSANLHMTFYYLQIQIHRPFIQKTSPLSFPSLAICTNAARACSHVIDAKGPGWIYPFPNLFMSTFASGIVLILHVYGGRRAGLNTDTSKEMKDIQRCVDTLRAIENRWHVAGRLVDVLTEIMSMHQGEVPEYTPFSPNKRPRDTKIQPEQPSGPTSPDTTRPLKSWPTRRPKGWPPTSPTPNQEPSIFGGEQDAKIKFSTPPDMNCGPTLPTHSPLPAGHDPPDMTRLPQMGYTPAEPGWDLNHLLLAQMNFGGPSQHIDPPFPRAQAYQNTVPSGTTRNSASATSLGNPDNSYNMLDDYPAKGLSPLPLMTPFAAFNQPAAVTQDMAAMWSDAPSSFNFEDWDQFVTSFNGSNGI